MAKQFEGNAFISYAHLDNIELVEGHKGWVANLQRALQARLGQLLGRDAAIWWDPKLQGNDYFAITLVERLQRVAALVTVVSPRYCKSEWGRKEIDAFCEAASQQACGIRVGDKARIFKVLKTPVPPDQHPPELQSLLGYEFFKVDSETGRVRELDEVFGPEAQRDFWLKLDDLAHDMCCLLEMLESDPSADAVPTGGGEAVYVAVTTADLKEQREAIKRDLEQHGHLVLPDRQLPSTATELEAAVCEDLARCRMSIHMVGSTYSLVPEGGMASLIEIQNELAIHRAKQDAFSRLVWIPPDLQVKDPRQQQLIDRLRGDARSSAGTDLLERPLEDLRTAIRAWFSKQQKPQSATGRFAAASGPPQLYLIYDKPDSSVVSPFADFLFKDFEVINPGFDGDEAKLREDQEENLRNCDGVLIFFGSGNECWLRRKLREVQKSPGYGRTKPAPLVGICMVGSKTAEKERFRTHDAMVVAQWDGLTPEGMRPFVDALKAGEPPSGDQAGAIHG